MCGIVSCVSVWNISTSLFREVVSMVGRYKNGAADTECWNSWTGSVYKIVASCVEEV